MSDEWFTPVHIFDALGLEFDLDPCSPPSGSVVPAKQVYSLPFDGLSAPWFGLVWMNPPYSKPTPWVDKWLEHGNGLALLPQAKSKWFRKLWHSQAALISLEPNFKFNRPDGSSGQIFMNCILAGIGNVGYQAMLRSNLGRVR